MRQLKIRPFMSFDMSAILRIEKTSFGIDAFSERTFNDLHTRSPSLFIVADLNDRVLGYMITAEGNDKSHVISIAVDPFHRRRGIGRALADHTFEKLRAGNIKTVDLEVRITNREAINFWKQLGFHPLSVVSKYYNKGEDALRMRKSFEAQHGKRNKSVCLRDSP